MTDQSPRRNSFRAAVLRGEKTPLVVEEKQSHREGPCDALDSVIVPRSESRRSNHRDQDRHRLDGETATVRHGGTSHRADIVNISGGGAMIRADFAPMLWDMVELELAEGHAIECAVRWRRGDDIGLEFAHETRIECDPEERAKLLLDVLQRNFPGSQVHLECPAATEEKSETEAVDLGNRAETRHPLIWKGEIHFAHDSNPVRLRNISTGGALVDVVAAYPKDAEVLLDLGDAGQFFATVSWIGGDQMGLSFKEPFDLACLARARPELTPNHWMKLDFLAQDNSSPWDEKWSRSSLEEMRTELESYLGR